MRAADGAVREHYGGYDRWLAEQPPQVMRSRREEAEVIFRRVGITFAVYGAKDDAAGQNGGTERLIPFDLIPRVIPAHEWREMERGLRQRVTALNRFIHDVYHEQEILKAGVVPAEQVLGNAQFRAEMKGVEVAGNIYSHIAGIDIVRAANADGSGSYYVLEDNLRVPSGVSLHAREPQDDDAAVPRAVQPAPRRAGRALPRPAARDAALGRAGRRQRPDRRRADAGHVQQRLLRARLPGAADGRRAGRGAGPLRRATTSSTCARRRARSASTSSTAASTTTSSIRSPSAPIRRSAAPACSTPTAPATSRCRNAIGTGVADDKSIYPYVPKMIEFYLGEQPILNNVPTYAVPRRRRPRLRARPPRPSSSSRKCTAPAATACSSARRRPQAEIEEFRAALKARPDNYIAQPTLALSTCPTFVDAGIAPRHIDLRPFVLTGKKVQMVPGGLTRVALKEGSLVVNSSQGGGTKDTWVLEGWMSNRPDPMRRPRWASAFGPKRPLAAQGRTAALHRSRAPRPRGGSSSDDESAPQADPRSSQAALWVRAAPRTTRRPRGRRDGQAGAPSRRGQAERARNGPGPERRTAASGRMRSAEPPPLFPLRACRDAFWSH